MSLVTPVRRRQPVLVAAVLICAASMLALGAWAFLAPESFARFIDYPPYNRHLIHDAGAFQLGIGATVLLALWWSDALVVALTGFAVASGLHTVSHWTDRNLGGHGSDVPSLGLLTLVALIAIYARIQERKRRSCSPAPAAPSASRSPASSPPTATRCSA